MSDPTLPPSPRPAQPVLSPKISRTDTRTVRPRATATEAVPLTPVIVAAPPPPRGPSPWAAASVRQTLVPPCLVLALAAIGLGAAYFCQPADTALRQVGVAVPLLLLAAGGLTLGVAALLMASLRRPTTDGRLH